MTERLTFEERCAIAQQAVQPYAYQEALTALHAEMLADRKRLLMVIQSAHDRLLRGDDDNVLLELLQEGWAA